MRAAGLRPIQIWVPDFRSKSFKAKVRRQVADLDPSLESEAIDFIDAVKSDV
ncbi:MAG TPA: antitoxin MazE-like protein [Gammaproteobacteria bacterium]|nr:antitoxin MazE-like protein [Gammaproteobacteria bacterium]